MKITPSFGVPSKCIDYHTCTIHFPISCYDTESSIYFPRNGIFEVESRTACSDTWMEWRFKIAGIPYEIRMEKEDVEQLRDFLTVQLKRWP